MRNEMINGKVSFLCRVTEITRTKMRVFISIRLVNNSKYALHLLWGISIIWRKLITRQHWHDSMNVDESVQWVDRLSSLCDYAPGLRKSINWKVRFGNFRLCILYIDKLTGYQSRVLNVTQTLLVLYFRV